MALLADRRDLAPAALATVLLLDGDPTRRRAVVARLRAAGFAVHTAADGAQALAVARRRPPDLLLLDASPGAGGPHVCRAVRGAADRRLRTVPILLLAAGATEAERIAGLEAGADACDASPFTLRELLARVRALLRRAPRAPAAAGARGAPPVVAGGLVLDAARHRVLRSGREVELRPKEFALLAFLLDQAGRVFTRPQLLAGVWGGPHVGGERTVDVHVRRLREKLERQPSRPALLETVHGVGYRFRTSARFAGPDLGASRALLPRGAGRGAAPADGSTRRRRGRPRGSAARAA